MRWSKGLSVTKTMPALERVGEAVDGEAGEGDGRLDVGIFHRDVAHLADDGLGAVERGALRAAARS